MRDRFTLLGLATLGAMAAAVPLLLRARRSAAPTDCLPAVHVDFAPQPFADLFRQGANGDFDRLPVVFTDVEQPPRPAKASLRGFSDWHHRVTKPSLRVRHRDKDLDAAAANDIMLPADVELSRPEDPLALCNWLPDQLADGLGLLHERSRPVHLWLDGRDAGVYLRSLRPGDDLSAAFGRERGTFWKGDSLGERSHVDLWASTDGWRSTGADNPRAERALDRLLAMLRAPATPESRRQLGTVLDLEAAARCSAVAVLCGSIHADRAHNHVFFFDPERDRLEPLLWDANGFGIHAEPDLPIDVARHPLAERLLCDPRFVHRRNEVLWDLMHGAGAPAAIAHQVDAQLQRLLPALQHDPEIARLVLHNGVFTVQPLSKEQIPAARAELLDFVARRDAVLREYFAAARASATPSAIDREATEVTVYGTVAVRLSRTDGGPVSSSDGRDASLLWPGLSAELFAAPQHRTADGTGVAAPFARPTPLRYEVDVPIALLRAQNAFTGEPIELTGAPPEALPTRSVHPWSSQPAAVEIELGPGTVDLRSTLVVPANATLHIAPGTHIRLASDVGIQCRGRLVAIGERGDPITITGAGDRCRGLSCIGSADVQMAHVRLEDRRTWHGPSDDQPPALALRGCQRAKLDSIRVQHASGHGVEIIASRAELSDCIVHTAAGIGLAVSGFATVIARRSTFAFARCGATASDGARLQLHHCELRGNVIGALAQRTARGWPGGAIRLEQVACEGNGQCDVDADAFGSIELLDTRAIPGSLAAGRVHTLAAQPAAGPR